MKTVFTVTFFICMMLIASIAWSEIVYVNGTTGDDATGERGNPNKPFKAIQKGIDVAVSGEDRVLVADGTYTGEGNKNLDFKGKVITVTSENGAENCIIDCEDDGVGFHFHSGETEESVVSGFTITNSYTTDYYGGGIRCYYRSSPTIQNNKISGNSAEYQGGGIVCFSYSSPTIINNTISGNSASWGGIYCWYSSPTIQNNEISGNSAAYGGGGIYCWRSSPTIQNNEISGNSTDGEGGGIYCDESFPTIQNSEISGNSAAYGGGGIVCFSFASPTIINNTISGNSAEWGGGIYCLESSSPTVLNTILWADSPDEIYVDETSEIDITYSDIQDGWEGESNIDADPLFVDADNDIYYLRAGSPCLSTAKPNCEGAPETDKDGQSRPLGSGCDMGCYEECDNGIFGYISSSNCDISAYDASLVLQSVVGLIDLSERQKIAADVTGDDTVTALDAALILQYTVGLITQFPIQKGAPTLTAKDEKQILTQIIAELENVSLTAEQKHVLEQLKQLIWRQSIPSHTDLLQNYPNPFNPETWIPYKLAQDASITIRIFNVKGQLVRTLHLGNQNAGVYMAKDKAAHWDGKDSLGQSVASGVYFYTLQVERQRNPDGDGAETFTAARKMVILK